MDRERMMKKFVICLSTSLLLLGILVLALRLFTGPEKTSGAHYWEILLNGWGRELGRDADRVTFFWQAHHGWLYLRTTQSEINAARQAAGRKFIDSWISYHKTDNGDFHFDRWDKLQFAALTDYRADAQPSDPRDWWLANQKTFSPSARQLAAYLEERRRQAKQQRSLATSKKEQVLDDDNLLALLNNHSVRSIQYLHSEDTDAAMAAWLTSRRTTWNFCFEAVYFPALVFYFAYLVPAILRRFRRHWLRFIMLGVLIHLGLALPYAFGYLPHWDSTQENQGGLLYYVVFTISELPPLLCLDALPRHLAGTIEQGLSHLCAALDHVLYPILARINEPGTPFASCSGGSERGFILLLGTACYASISLVMGMLVVMVRKFLKSRGTSSP